MLDVIRRFFEVLARLLTWWNSPEARAKRRVKDEEKRLKALGKRIAAGDDDGLADELDRLL